MLSSESFTPGAASLCARHLGSIALLVLLTSCSFHSTQLSFIQGILKESSAEEEAIYYWMLTLPDVSLRAVPIIQSNQLFFSDGQNYLVSVGSESLAEIRALNTGVVEKLAITTASEAERLAEGTLPPVGSGQTPSINKISENGLATDGGLIVRRKTRLPDTLFFCSSWVYRSDKMSSNRLCEDEQGRMLKFTHDLDDRGLVKRFNVMLDDQLLIDLERTAEVISY